MLSREDYRAADQLIEGALKMYQDSFEKAKNKLASVIEKINELNRSHKIDLSYHQFKSIVQLIAAIQKHDVQEIETQVENLYVHGEVSGVLKELIDVAQEFETLNFKE